MFEAEIGRDLRWACVSNVCADDAADYSLHRIAKPHPDIKCHFREHLSVGTFKLIII